MARDALLDAARDVADEYHHAFNCSAQRHDNSGDHWIEGDCDCGIAALAIAIEVAAAGEERRHRQITALIDFAREAKGNEEGLQCINAGQAS